MPCCFKSHCFSRFDTMTKWLRCFGISLNPALDLCWSYLQLTQLQMDTWSFWKSKAAGSDASHITLLCAVGYTNWCALTILTKGVISSLSPCGARGQVVCGVCQPLWTRGECGGVEGKAYLLRVTAAAVGASSLLRQQQPRGWALWEQTLVPCLLPFSPSFPRHIGCRAMPAQAKAPWGWVGGASYRSLHWPPFPRDTAWCSTVVPGSYGWAEQCRATPARTTTSQRGGSGTSF